MLAPPVSECPGPVRRGETQTRPLVPISATRPSFTTKPWIQCTRPPEIIIQISLKGLISFTKHYLHLRLWTSTRAARSDSLAGGVMAHAVGRESAGCEAGRRFWPADPVQARCRWKERSHNNSPPTSCTFYTRTP